MPTWIPSWTLLLLSCLELVRIGAVSAIQPNLASRQIGYVGTTSFINRDYHSGGLLSASWLTSTDRVTAIELGGYLYIDGGDISYHDKGVFEHVPDNNTYAIDLSSDWTNETVYFNAIPKTAPVLCYSHLLPDRVNQVIYSFSGEQCRALSPAESPPVPPTSLWRFTPNGPSGSWEQVMDVQGIDSITRPAGASAAFGGGQAFLLCGYSTSRTSSETNTVIGNQPLPGLLKYNYTSNTFTNQSTLNFNTHGTSEFGEMHYVPGSAFARNSTDGLLAAFGGDYSTAVEWVDNGAKLRLFNTIHLYSPATDTWYNQTATGLIPEARDRFCSTGAAGDNGTYEIFIFGGHVASASGDVEASANIADQARNILRDEVFVLTIPGFNWQKAKYSPAWPRIGHTCNLIGKRQMVVVGGLNPAATTKDELLSQQDPWANGIGIFDVTEMKWKDKYDSNAEGYTTPQVVKNWYSSNGGAYPKSWNDAGLEAYFTGQQLATNTSSTGGGGGDGGSSSTTTPAPAISSSSPTSGSSGGGGGSSTGAIVGGVVGGIGGALIIVAGLWFLLRRKKQSPKPAEDAYSLHSREDGNRSVDDGHPPAVPVGIEKPMPAELSSKRASRPAELSAQEARTGDGTSPWSSHSSTLRSPVSPQAEAPRISGRVELAA